MEKVPERTSVQDRQLDAERMEESDAELVALDSVDVELLAGRGVDPELRVQDSETGEDVDEEPTEGWRWRASLDFGRPGWTTKTRRKLYCFVVTKYLSSLASY